MSGLNGREFRVAVKDPYSFEIDCDTSSLGAYERGGHVTEVKEPITLKFAPFAQSLANPGAFTGDVSKLHRMGALHLGFSALHQFRQTLGRLPHPGNAQDADTVLNTCISMNAAASAEGLKVDDLSDHTKLVRRLAMCCVGEVSPVCGILGGIVGQEVLKACSGKFSPLQQWYYFDALEALSDEPLSEAEVTPMGCRYDSQISVFGRTIQSKLQAQSMFLVGAGAIGCEMLKTWALMGVSCGSEGSASGVTHVTDMDRIELSNLSRQFLFRTADINQAKSSTAARAVLGINPAMVLRAYEQKVGPETEEIFSDDFYDSIDMVCTALDNVEARLYVDQRCLFYQKPMLESGTQGTKGNTQVVVPRETESYGATRDPPEQSIPVCTLKHFPNNIAHTLQWAREWFEEMFRQTAEDTNAFIDSGADFESSLAVQQNMVSHVLGLLKCNSLLTQETFIETRHSHAYLRVSGEVSSEELR
jgi:ubiquitin-activating enzyme E1